MATAAIALSLFGCDKSGTVSGQVLDAFTGKPVEMPTVWMDSTIYGTQSQNYAYKDLLKEGQFKFEGVKVGTYLIKARRSKYILGQQKFTTSNENPNLEITLYEYPDTVSPGMYMAGVEGGTKVTKASKVDPFIENGSLKIAFGGEGDDLLNMLCGLKFGRFEELLLQSE